MRQSHSFKIQTSLATTAAPMQPANGHSQTASRDHPTPPITDTALRPQAKTRRRTTSTQAQQFVGDAQKERNAVAAYSHVYT